jgi:hypothetical protein
LVLGILLLCWFPSDLEMFSFKLHLKFINCLLGIGVASEPLYCSDSVRTIVSAVFVK